MNCILIISNFDTAVYCFYLKSEKCSETLHLSVYRILFVNNTPLLVINKLNES
jgi:hypothetical protein